MAKVYYLKVPVTQLVRSTLTSYMTADSVLLMTSFITQHY